MTRKEHRIKALNSVYENLCFASIYCLSHNELTDLRKQIENLREKVSKMIDTDMEDEL